MGVGVVRQSRSNELEVAQRVRDAIASIAPTLPPGIEITMGVDFTIFVRESIEEVYFTLWIAFAAVVLVNLFFLQSKTTTAIASVAIPVAVIGTFAALAVLDFSLNVLTLLALVLSIGLVVDDAIVVMENVYRRQELGEGAAGGGAQGLARGGLPGDRDDRGAGGGAGAALADERRHRPPVPRVRDLARRRDRDLDVRGALAGADAVRALPHA